MAPHLAGAGMFRATVLLAALVVAGLASAARADDWPQFRGPERDGVSPEKGLLRSWPKDGPPRLWQAKDIGDGWANLAEYALGGQPKSAETESSDLVLDAHGRQHGGKWYDMQVEYKRRKGAADVEYGVEVTGDLLGQWQEAPDLVVDGVEPDEKDG